MGEVEVEVEVAAEARTFLPPTLRCSTSKAMTAGKKRFAIASWTQHIAVEREGAHQDDFDRFNCFPSSFTFQTAPITRV